MGRGAATAPERSLASGSGDVLAASPRQQQPAAAVGTIHEAADEGDEEEGYAVEVMAEEEDLPTRMLSVQDVSFSRAAVEAAASRRTLGEWLAGGRGSLLLASACAWVPAARVLTHPPRLLASPAEARREADACRRKKRKRSPIETMYRCVGVVWSDVAWRVRHVVCASACLVLQACCVCFCRPVHSAPPDGTACPKSCRSWWYRKMDIFHLLLTMALALDDRCVGRAGRPAGRQAGRRPPRQQRGSGSATRCPRRPPLLFLPQLLFLTLNPPGWPSQAPAPTARSSSRCP